MSSSNGIHEESISNLRLFFHNLEQSNPNTVAKIKKDMYDRLQMCFVALGCVIYTFCACMLPVVYVDIVPLNGEFLKSMFIALAKDGNHEVLVLAFGVGGEDTVASAKWFLRNLKNCLGNVREIGFITKMVGSVSTALQSVFPDSYHGYCYRSVLWQFQNIYGHDNALGILCTLTIRTYSIVDFQVHLSGIKNMLGLQNVWIESFACPKWARAWFPDVRWNVMTMDIPGRIERLAGERRSRPLTNFIEVILDEISSTYLRRRVMLRNFGHITPYAKRVLYRRCHKSKKWNANQCGNLYFKVTDFRHTEEVWLSTKSCICGKWKHSGIPCRHALAALRSLQRKNVEEEVDTICTSAMHRAAYAWGVVPIPPTDEWELPNEHVVLLPPS